MKSLAHVDITYKLDLPCYPMGMIQYYQITCQPINQAICIFITLPIVFCNLVSIKCIIVLLYKLCCPIKSKTKSNLKQGHKKALHFQQNNIKHKKKQYYFSLYSVKIKFL